MKIMVTTDTHYGFDNNSRKIHKKFTENLAEECKKKDIKILVHCGDWIAKNQEELPKTWRMFRKTLGPDIKILTVEGNHDFWSYKYWGREARARQWIKWPENMTYIEMVEQHKDWAKEYDIHLLEKNPYRHDPEGPEDTIFYGYSGWYNSVSPPSKDHLYMFRACQTAPMLHFMHHKGCQDFEWVINQMDDNKYPEKTKKVCVTHFNFISTNGRYGMSSYPQYLDYLTMRFDLVLHGHSHQREDKIHEVEYGNGVRTCRVFNSGTRPTSKKTYNNIRYEAIEI